MEKTCWCIYCKEKIDHSKGMVVKNGKIFHLSCWKLLNEIEDDFGDLITDTYGDES